VGKGPEATRYSIYASHLFSSFLHSCRHLPYCSYSINLKVVEMGSERLPVAWARSQSPEALKYWHSIGVPAVIFVGHLENEQVEPD
jgi:hypothetical protein